MVRRRPHLDASVEWSTSCFHQGFSYFLDRMVFFLSSLAFFFTFFIAQCLFSPLDISMSKDFSDFNFMSNERLFRPLKVGSNLKEHNVITCYPVPLFSITSIISVHCCKIQKLLLIWQERKVLKREVSASIEQIWNIVASCPKFVFSPTFIFCCPICSNNCGVVFLRTYILVFEKWLFSFDRSNIQIFTVNITGIVWPHVTNVLDLRYFC